MTISRYMRELRSKVGSTLLELPSVSILTFDRQDRVLLVKHADSGRWTTPGGAIEPLEVPADAALREMWEETGLEVELLRILGVYGGPSFSMTYSNGDAVSFVMTVFEGRVVAGSPRPDGEETLEVAYFSREEARATLLQPWLPAVLDDVYRERARPHFEEPTWQPPGR